MNWRGILKPKKPRSKKVIGMVSIGHHHIKNSSPRGDQLPSCYGKTSGTGSVLVTTLMVTPLLTIQFKVHFYSYSFGTSEIVHFPSTSVTATKNNTEKVSAVISLLWSCSIVGGESLDDDSELNSPKRWQASESHAQLQCGSYAQLSNPRKMPPWKDGTARV